MSGISKYSMTATPRFRRLNPACHDAEGDADHVVGIFPNEAAITVEAFLLSSTKWALQRTRYMTLETSATLSDDPTASLPPLAVA